jgi:hypothetical protein
LRGVAFGKKIINNFGCIMPKFKQPKSIPPAGPNPTVLPGRRETCGHPLGVELLGYDGLSWL